MSTEPEPEPEVAEERFDVVILGRKIGTANGWDDVAPYAMVFYNFQPVEELPEIIKTSDNITILYDQGLLVDYADDDGSEIYQLDLVSLVLALPKVAK